MAFGDSDWAGDRETRRSTTAVLEKLGNHCNKSVPWSQTVIALSSGVLRLAASSGWCVPNTAYLNRLGRPMRAIVRSDSTAAIGISSRSGASKPRHLGAKELWIQEIVQARRRRNKVHRGRPEARALVELEWIEDDEGLGADSLERGDGGPARLCEHRAHSRHSDGLDSRCDCDSLARDSNNSSYGLCLLLAGWQGRGWAKSVLSRRTMTRRLNSDCSKGRLVPTETHGCWRGAGQWKSCGGIVGALDDTDMCDKDVVIMRWLRMASTATAAQCIHSTVDAVCGTI